MDMLRTGDAAVMSMEYAAVTDEEVEYARRYVVRHGSGDPELMQALGLEPYEKAPLYRDTSGHIKVRA